MRMAYQRTGGPIIQWDRGSAPRSNVGQGRAADNLSLGAYTEETGGIVPTYKQLPGAIGPRAGIGNYEPVPMPGAPEIIGDIGPFPSAGNLLTLAAVGGAVWYFALGGKKYIAQKRKK